MISPTLSPTEQQVDLGIQEFDGLMENHKHASQPHQREKQLGPKGIKGDS